MATSDIIVTTELTCVRRTGERLNCLVEIAKPYQAETGEWACPLSLGELYPRLPDVNGEDSLQALCLALSLARLLLTYFVEDGGRILIAGTDSEFPVDAYFSRVGTTSTLP
jgi:hypothetical protein